jgi:hypothetical protein
MNFALSAIILVVILLPGAVAIKAYYSSLRSKASDRHIPLSELLLQGTLLSLVIHCTAVCIIHMQKKEVYFDFLYSCILGKEDKDFKFTNEQFAKNFLDFAFYIAACVVISYVVVKICKYFIHLLQFDTKYAFLRNANYWFSIFNKKSAIDKSSKKQRVIDFVMLDVYVKPDIIYSGVLIDFNYSPVKDELVSLVLAFAKRRKIIILPNSEQTPNVSPPLSVPGDTLILPMQDVVNINIRYVTYNDIEMDLKPDLIPGIPSNNAGSETLSETK